MKYRAALVASLLPLLAGPLAPAPAFQYIPTPLARALSAHDLVLVGTVKARAGGQVKVEPTFVVKGLAPGGLVTLPDTWRPGTEFTFGPVPLETGKTYLLMLRIDPRGECVLSSDFAAEAVVAVPSRDDPLVRAATVLHALSRQEKADARKETLARAWDRWPDEARQRLLQDFASAPADVATVPFLLRAMNAGPERSSLMEWSAIVLEKHQYREAVPGLLEALKKKDWACVYPARALAAMKERRACGPLLELIESPTGNRPSLLRSLSRLEDPRAIPFLVDALHRNLPGLDPRRGTYRSWSSGENEAAAEGLGRLRAREAVGPLVQVLGLEGQRDLRTLAVKALGEIGPAARSALPRIRGLMRAGQVEREVGEAAVRSIEGQ